MSRTASAILSTNNLLNNLRIIKQQASNSKIIAMVKANAYGHGLRSVALRLAKYVDLIGVASIDEALALRKVGVKTPILLIEGVFEPNELLIAATENFHVVFHSMYQLEWLKKLRLPTKLNSWLKVDTGMGRLGIDLTETKSFYEAMLKIDQIKQPIKIISHFACSEDVDHVINKKQCKNIDQLLNLPGEYSFCNSAAIFNFPQYQMDYVRPGIALYGISPVTHKTAASLGLKPVMTLQANLIAVRRMFKGSSIGYGARFICPEDMLVGVVPFGYGDGYPRTAVDGTPILVNNTRCSLIGTVSMDMLMVDLRNVPNAVVGDQVILWGEGLPIEEVTKYTKHIAYDLLTGIQNRVKFYWTIDNNIIEENDT